MIRIIEEKTMRYIGDTVSKTYIEAAGSSSDAKPTSGIAQGSIFFETDTWKFFAFDEETEQWNEKPES